MREVLFPVGDVTKISHHDKASRPYKQELNLCRVPIFPSLYESHPVEITTPP